MLAGLERLLRGFQSLLLICLGFDKIVLVILAVAAKHDEVEVSAHLAALALLKSKVNITRRVLRTFKFLEFSASATRKTLSKKQSLETYVEILFATFMAGFCLLETMTIPDLLGIPELQVWGVEMTGMLNLEAQRLWFLALACNVVCGYARLNRLSKGLPTTVVFGEKSENTQGNPQESRAHVKPEANEDQDRRADAGVTTTCTTLETTQHQIWNIKRRILSDCMDMILPCAALGWISIGTGRLGLVMLFTSFLTGLEVWERCGQQLVSRQNTQP